MKLPSPTELGLLKALGAQRLTGRQLALRYHELTGRKISYGSLYTTMGRLRGAGWVSQEDSSDQDGRLRYFRITGEGMKMVNESEKYFSRIFGIPFAIPV